MKLITDDDAILAEVIMAARRKAKADGDAAIEGGHRDVAPQYTESDFKAAVALAACIALDNLAHDYAARVKQDRQYRGVDNHGAGLGVLHAGFLQRAGLLS